MQKVQFVFHDRKPVLDSRRKLRLFIEEIFNIEGFDLFSLNYVFCSDEYLLGINKEFLKHDYFTDIITFDLSTGNSGIMAEIYISSDRVRENSKNLKVPFVEEFHRVIFHGALHLCGYKDHTKLDAMKMREKENEYLLMYFQVE